MQWATHESRNALKCTTGESRCSEYYSATRRSECHAWPETQADRSHILQKKKKRKIDVAEGETWQGKRKRREKGRCTNRSDGTEFQLMEAIRLEKSRFEWADTLFGTNGRFKQTNNPWKVEKKKKKVLVSDFLSAAVDNWIAFTSRAIADLVAIAIEAQAARSTHAGAGVALWAVDGVATGRQMDWLRKVLVAQLRLVPLVWLRALPEEEEIEKARYDDSCCGMTSFSLFQYTHIAFRLDLFGSLTVEQSSLELPRLCAKLISCLQVFLSTPGGVRCLHMFCKCWPPRYVVWNLAFSMCLLQCLHCTDEAHIGQNRGSPPVYTKLRKLNTETFNLSDGADTSMSASLVPASNSLNNSPPPPPPPPPLSLSLSLSPQQIPFFLVSKCNEILDTLNRTKHFSHLPLCARCLLHYIILLLTWWPSNALRSVVIWANRRRKRETNEKKRRFRYAGDGLERVRGNLSFKNQTEVSACRNERWKHSSLFDLQLQGHGVFFLCFSLHALIDFFPNSRNKTHTHTHTHTRKCNILRSRAFAP